MTNLPQETVGVVLAAGRGKRMHSALPKVLHSAAGKPLLAWVVEAGLEAGCHRMVVVIGHGGDEVRAHPQIVALEQRIASQGGTLTWVVQEQQRGTGHALLQIQPAVPETAQLLVLSGDAPLVRATTLRRLLAAAAAGWGAVAVAEMADGRSLGRVITQPGTAELRRIVEAADATPDELRLTLVNSGIYVLGAPEIFRHLAQLEPANAQGELYLTDALGAAAAAGRSITTVRLEDAEEALGVNDRKELAMVHRHLMNRHLTSLMRSGVTILEPARTSIEAMVCVGADTVIHPGVSLFGRTDIGSRCVLHQGAWIRDSQIEDGVTVEPYTVLDGALLGAGQHVGPLVHLPAAPPLQPGADASQEAAGSRNEPPQAVPGDSQGLPRVPRSSKGD